MDKEELLYCVRDKVAYVTLNREEQRNTLNQKAVEAENMGLITKAVEPSQLDREVKEVLKSLTSRSPIAFRIGKQAVRAIRDMSFDEQIDYLCEKLFTLISTEDAREGIKAFTEKRKPEFKGR